MNNNDAGKGGGQRRITKKKKEKRKSRAQAQRESVLSKVGSTKVATRHMEYTRGTCNMQMVCYHCIRVGQTRGHLICMGILILRFN